MNVSQMKIKYLLIIVALIAVFSTSSCNLPDFIGTPQPTTTSTAPTTPSPISPVWTPPTTATQTPTAVPTPQPSAPLSQLPEFVSVIAAVRPSVVAINTR